MDSPTLFFHSKNHPIQKIYTSPYHIYIQTDEGISVIDLKSKKPLLLIPNNSWSKDLLSVYNHNLNSIICFHSNKKSIELYRRRELSFQEESKQNSQKTCYKLKPKRYNLDDKISKVDKNLVYFENSESLPFNLDNLVNLQNEDEIGQDQIQQTRSDEVDISEIVEFLGIKKSVQNLFDLIFVNRDG